TPKIESRGSQHKQPVHPGESAQLDFPDPGNGFHPSEGALNQRPFRLADGVTFVAGGASVDRAAPAMVVLRNMRAHVHFAQSLYEVACVVALVGTQRTDRFSLPAALLDQPQCRLP